MNKTNLGKKTFLLVFCHPEAILQQELMTIQTLYLVFKFVIFLNFPGIREARLVNKIL